MKACDQFPIQLLRAAARLASDNEDSEGVIGWGQTCVAWDEVLEMAAAHGMRPLLNRLLLGTHRFQRARPRSMGLSLEAGTLEAMRTQEPPSLFRGFSRQSLKVETIKDDLNHLFGSAAIPEHISAELQEFTQQNLRKNLRLTGELIVLLRQLSEKSINAIAFKGPTLAALAYGNLGLREFGDLDLLIAKTDFMKTQDLLITQGYQPEILLNESQAAAFVESCNVMAFWHSQKEVSIELHWELSPKYLPFSPDLEKLRQRMVASYPGGQKVMTLSPEDLLVYLCAHGAKHVWERLIWIADVAGLIHRHSNLDWRKILDLAVEQRCERVLLLGLRLARDVAGAALPAQIEELIQRDLESERLAAKIVQWLFRDSNSTPGLGAQTIFILRLQKRLADKIRSFAQLATAPSAADWAAYPNFQRFTKLHTLLRPLRLMGKLVRGSR